MPAKPLLSNAMLAVANVVGGSVVLFLLYRYLLGSLGVEQLGVWSLLVSTIGVARLSDLGMTAGSTKYVASHLARGNPAWAARIVETTLLSLLALSVILVALCYPVARVVLPRFVPGTHFDAALASLPWLLAAFCANLTASVALSGLDGCQRIDLRAYASLASQIVLLAAAIALVPRYGLAGVAQAQLLQGLFCLIAAWTLLRRELRALPVLPCRWNIAAFKEVLAYSVAFQLGNVFLIVLDPIVKLLLARFGGLASTAYFDMANQLIQRLRQILVAGIQVIVPAAAQAHESGADHVVALYLKSYRTVFAVAIPYFCLIAALVPAVSVAWIGRPENTFVSLAWIVLAGLAVNTLGTPSYFNNLGTGDLRRNTVGFGLNTVLAALLGWLGGALFGALGVVTGWAIATMVNGLYIQHAFHRQNGLELVAAVPAESIAISGLSVVALIVCRVIDATFLVPSEFFSEPSLASQAARMIVLTAVFASLTATTIWYHPVRRSLTTRLVGLR
jgi:O-antigen/teichoic acid export membrane protein